MMQRMSLRVKLTASFGLMLMILAATSAANYFAIQKISQLSAVADTTAQEVYLALTIEALVNSRKTDIRSFLLSRKEEYMTQYQAHDRALADELAALEPLLTSEKGRNLFVQLKLAAGDYDHAAQQVADLARVQKMGATETRKVVILGVAEKRVALLVDHLLGQEATVVKPLGNYLHRCSSLAGATISGDGRVRLVLDPAGLLAASPGTSQLARKASA